MSDTLTVFDAESRRASEKFSGPQSPLLCLGVIDLKLHAFRRCMDSHSVSREPDEMINAKMSMIQIAVMAIRAVNSLGGISLDEYAGFVKINERTDRRYLNAEG